ncbi:leucyl/phenylalanyl-tRNA--protein transferase [Endozoicomonas ascidiicola]|uniref:leucyl/phenylalanyl-tRNA--protein transferase n=1 Tax=Endozoicomonas ascidiicola TaxID=1698521 RepID=UPI000B133390|nr:leucyl/phenylalanyl-tRNA--protein transferase [Endozoicomonas ascidiicola]
MQEILTLLADSNILFPDPEKALDEPDGLLAVGGNLSIDTLLQAYHKGIFPWFSEDDPILWWSPGERMVLHPDQFHISKSLLKLLRKSKYQVTMDHDFSGVIHHCSTSRQRQEGTWITDEMMAAYIDLHRAGYAHSVEVWHEQTLVGGLYGVSLGSLFFGESMFSLQSNTSKIAFAALANQLHQWGFKLIDCQMHSTHLASLGAVTMPRQEFTGYLNRYCRTTPTGAHWKKAWQWIDHQQ